jgi:hypothetical protein
MYAAGIHFLLIFSSVNLNEISISTIVLCNV